MIKYINPLRTFSVYDDPKEAVGEVIGEYYEYQKEILIYNLKFGKFTAAEKRKIYSEIRRDYCKYTAENLIIAPCDNSVLFSSTSDPYTLLGSKLQKHEQILSKTKTYLVGPIEFIPQSQENKKSWRDTITEELNKLNITVFNPVKKPYVKNIDENQDLLSKLKQLRADHKYHEVATQMKEIRNFDLGLVDKSDFIIFYYDPKVPTVGSWHELVQACLLKKPIFFINPAGKETTPLWVFSMFPHKYIYSSIGEAVNTLRAIHEGDKEIDSDRWRLLVPELR